MAESSWQPVMGAAQRRRQRRLRSWWRHEQQSIAAALATVMHHSSGKVHTANGAPRSQKLATRAEEEVEYEPHYALRGQKTPPPGERLAPLSEVAGPQRSDRTVRHSAGEAPLLVVPSLRGADGVDGTTVSFLLAENLKLQKKKEEEKERRREREEAQHEARMRELDRRVRADVQLTPAESYAWRKWAGHLPSEPRRKKKRKKKKLPRAPRPQQGCRRLCDHQRQVPVVRIPVMMQRQVPTVHSFMLPVQFLDTVLDMLVVVLRQVPGLMVQKTVVRPQLQYAPVVRVVLPWRRSWRSHSCSSLRNRRPFFLDCGKLRTFRSCSSLTSSSTSLSCRKRRSSWSRLFSRPQSFLSCCTFQVLDAPVVLVVLTMPRSCRQRQFAPKAGYAGFDVPQLCSSWLLQAKIFVILAGMTRRTVTVACTILVMPVAMHLALFSRPGLQAHDARHHGLFGPKGLWQWHV